MGFRPLVELGYAARGQHGDDTLRRYFTRDEQGRRLVQLHVWWNKNAHSIEKAPFVERLLEA